MMDIHSGEVHPHDLQRLPKGSLVMKANSVVECPAVSATGSSVRWDVTAPNARLSVTIAAPDGRIFRQEAKGGSAEVALFDKQGNRLPDGQYTYELRLTPAL
jgi:hypothetical protein